MSEVGSNVNKTTLENETIKIDLEGEINDIKQDQSQKTIVFDLSLRKDTYPNKVLSGKVTLKNIIDKIFNISGFIAFTTDNQNTSPYFKFPEPLKIDHPCIFDGYCSHEAGANNVHDDIETIKILYKDNYLHVYPTKHLKQNSKQRLNIKFSHVIYLPNFVASD